MNRLLISTIIILGLGGVLLALLQVMSGTTKVIAPDGFEPPLKNIPQVNGGEYLPEGLEDLRMNMPLSEFLETVHGQHGVREDKGFRETVTTGYADTVFSAVRFYFDSDTHKPLYEFIIEFPEDFDLANYVKQKYGEPTHGGEWRFRNNDDYYIMIWTVSFANRLIIAANIDGTEQEYRK